MFSYTAHATQFQVTLPADQAGPASGRDEAKRLNVDARLTIEPGRDDFTLYTVGDDRLGLHKTIAAQMGATAAK